MEQPLSFEVPDKEDWIFQLLKSIYGMKQASHIWNITFNKAVTTWGFEQLPCEWCVYRCQSPTGTIIFSLHIDDIFSATLSPDETAAFKAFLELQWEIADLGPAKFTLGIAMTCDTSSHSISLF
jgi:hypothetical protein